ncbi:MAG: helix-turn-helix transcriptional regulator [Aquabacterium sp.]|uniref:ATP-binding protein n=1 Tax=Aquabacterium sp. TaxID=1872578 RepID=UPI0025C0DA13|nr:winged helix-turn-helix domain-containing protein [Aquabacterium sp.]MBI3381346.1 helix-turn-helix transcriptional regulator [Aquabacterium sp.]
MSRNCYRFDRFELRPTERVLYLEGEPTNLGARAVEVLTVLVSEYGRVVGKSELLDRVWPNVVVEENNLQVQISSLRKLLGAKSIATVPGRGYRFCLPVDSDAERPAGTTQPLLQAPKAVDDVLSVLPAMPGPIWGREADQAALDALLPAPLITLVGQAGIGKTAFALSVAHAWRPHRRDGAAWVELAAIADPDLVVSMVAQGLGLSSGGQDPLQALVAALKPLQVLLVIDNAEHVLDAVTRLVQAVMAGAPEVRILVTSQLPLRLPNERVFRLGPLSVPPLGATVDEAMKHGAVALFVDQVKAVNRHFELNPSYLARVVGLCNKLDGVALAIKLAAARVPLLGLQGVEERLSERFKLLHHGHGAASAPTRQQTLLAALDWSHEMLSPPERAVFRRLAVLAGGFTLDLAKSLAHDQDLDEWAVIDVLGSLVDRSLVMADAGETPRYRLLDSMRDYAGLKLVESGELPDIRQRHAQAMVAMMDAAYEDYWAQSDTMWLSHYGPEIDNVRMALDWAVQHDQNLAVRLLGASSPLFMLLGLAPECRQRGLGLEQRATSPQPGADVARFWLERSRLYWGVGNTLMHDFALRASALYRAAADRRGLYLALRCLAGSGVLPSVQALSVLDEMAALEQPDWPIRLCTQRLLAEVTVLKSIEHMAEARRVCQNLLVRAQSAGLEGVVSAALNDLASISMALGDTDAALQTCAQILARGRHRRDNFVLHALAVMACVAFVKSDLATARSALTDFVSASRSRDWEWLGLYAGLLALMAALEGRHEAAARLLGYTAKAYEQMGSRDVVTVYAWSRTNGLVQDALDPTVFERLKGMGAGLDPESVATWALSPPPG